VSTVLEMVADLERARDEYAARVDMLAAEREAGQVYIERVKLGLDGIAQVLASLGVTPAASTAADTFEGRTAEAWANVARAAANDLRGALEQMAGEREETAGQIRAAERATLVGERQDLAAKVRDLEATLASSGGGDDAPTPLVEGRDVRAWAAEYHRIEDLLRDLVEACGEDFDEDDAEKSAKDAGEAAEAAREDLEALRSAVSDALEIDLDDDKIDLPEEVKIEVAALAEQIDADPEGLSELRAQIDRSEVWTWKGFLEAVAADPSFVRTRIMPPSTTSAAAYAAHVATPAPAAPPVDDVPAGLMSFAGLCLGDPPGKPSARTRREARASWARHAGQPDREDRFRADMNALGNELPPPADEPPAPLDEPTPAEVPEAKRKRNDRAEPIPADWCPDAAQMAHGTGLGFTESQVKGFALAFRAEALKSQEPMARPGARFRGYLNDRARDAKGSAK